MSSQEVPIPMHKIMTKTQPNFFRQNNSKVKPVNSKIFPDDFFGLPSKDKEDIQQIKLTSQKDHPKLLNPLNSKQQRNPLSINEIKEEATEESIDHSQIKRNNLQIIVPPDSSNDEIEPSTAGSSNHKLSALNSSPIIIDEKNKNIFSFSSKVDESSSINSEKKPNKIFNKEDNTLIKDEEMFKVTPHFINDPIPPTLGSQEEIQFIRPLTPNINLINKAPLTCNNNSFAQYKFNYNYELSDNDVIVPTQNLFKEKNENKDTKKNNTKIDNNSKISKCVIKPLIPKKEIVKDNPINTPRNTAVTPHNRYNLNNDCNKNKKNILTSDKVFPRKAQEFIKNKKEETNKEKFQRKNQRPNSVCNKNIDYPLKKKNSNESNNKDLYNHLNNNKRLSSKKTPKNREKNKNMLPYIAGNKLCYVQLKVEQEIYNLFKNMPDNEKDSDVCNYYHLLMKKIKGMNEDFNSNKKTQSNFRPRRSDVEKNDKKNKF